MRSILWVFCGLWLAAVATAGEVQELRSEVKELASENADMRAQLEVALRQIAAIQAQVSAGVPPVSASPLDQAVQEIEKTSTERGMDRKQASGPEGGRRGIPRLAAIGASINAAAGSSTVRDSMLKDLQGGGHDPHKRGFTLQQAELSILGAVDPYLNAEAHLLFFIDPNGETKVELEEAFVTTQALPYGLQLEAGQFFTEFGRINPTHPHAWNFLDQPVILTRMFGGDGMRGPGVRGSWLVPLPWFSELHIGAQNANGETMTSFLATDANVGGSTFLSRETRSLDDLVYLLRWVNGFDLSDTWSTQFGVSKVYGPNSTGKDGMTSIVGADFVAKWRPENQRRGWPFVILEGEALHRTYKVDNSPGVAETTLRDWGVVAQGLWGFCERWAAGLRAEYAAGSGSSTTVRSTDPLRDDRLRVSPLLVFYPTEFSRIRFQTNYDKADHLREDSALSFWLGVDISVGDHPAHQF